MRPTIPAALVLFFASSATAQPVTLVSRSTSGTPGNSASVNPKISADGRFVAFGSLASNLVPNDTNGKGDVFVHDLQTGETTRVSVSSSGAQGNDSSGVESGPGGAEGRGLAISSDGRFVAFYSRATNLVSGVDPTFTTNVYVHDRDTGATTCVSVRADNGQPAGKTDASTLVAISVDGRFVTARQASRRWSASAPAGCPAASRRSRTTGVARQC
jgi:Tol biopolymer transport system component